MNEIDKARLALVPVLAERSPTGRIGRTALMKYMYFLQILRGLPLGYNFSMYSYGPFDSEVLSDLMSAEVLNIVEASPVQFSGGYGYRIKPSIQAEFAKNNAIQFLSNHNDDIEWLFLTFGRLNSAELELTSTIVYIDQEFADANSQLSTCEMATRLQEIKPHFNSERIHGFVEDLIQKNVLKATVRASEQPC
jgi:uncharacterized protein